MPMYRSIYIKTTRIVIGVLRITKMILNLEKLMKFDLIEGLESEIKNENKHEMLIEFLKLCQQIQNVDQFIRECPAYPGSTDKIRKSELVSSVGATLAIEGTKLTKEEIEISFEKAELHKELERKEQETQNTKIAYDYIIDLVVRNRKDKFIYKEEYIKQIHKHITDNIEYGLNAPGKYRDVNPIYGEPPRRSLCSTKALVEMTISKFIDWLNKDSRGLLSGNRFAKAIMAHYYLAEIHPFGDGNGRTARALEALILFANKINTYCFWSLANFWSANRSDYIVHLGNIRATCNVWDFVMWGLKGYLKEVERIKGLVLNKAKQLMLMDYVRWLLANKKHQKREKKINKRIEGIIELLTHIGEMPLDKFLSNPQIKALYYKRSEPTRYRDFEKMKNIGLIRIFEKDNTKYIGPNYQLLEYLEYKV